MIEEINRLLKAIGSNYSTDDGLLLITYIGNLTFLRMSFETQQDCLQYVKQIAEEMGVS